MADDKKRFGLYGKYRVFRTDGKPVREAFVLEDTDPLAPPALWTYSEWAEEEGYAALAKDLREMYRRWPREREDWERQLRGRESWEIEEIEGGEGRVRVVAYLRGEDGRVLPDSSPRTVAWMVLPVDAEIIVAQADGLIGIVQRLRNALRNAEEFGPHHPSCRGAGAALPCTCWKRTARAALGMEPGAAGDAEALDT